MLRKKFRRIVVENYRRQQPRKPSGEQPDQGVTVTLSVAACVVPEVAVTVILEVPGGVPIFFGGALFPLPQLTRQRASAVPPHANDHFRAFWPRLPLFAKNNANMVPTDHAVKIQGGRPANGTAAAELGAVVVMVSVVETGPAPGVRLAGEKVQVDAAGKPLQANATEEFKPLTGLTVMVNVAA